eukprot:9117009-Pyramimonas_sp.AAC.1
MSSASKVAGLPPGEVAPPGTAVRPPGMPPMLRPRKHKPAALVPRQPDGPPPARLRTPLPPGTWPWWVVIGPEIQSWTSSRLQSAQSSWIRSSSSPRSRARSGTSSRTLLLDRFHQRDRLEAQTSGALR